MLIKGYDSVSGAIVPLKVTADGTLSLATDVTLDPTNLALNATVLTGNTTLASLLSRLVLAPGTPSNVAIGAAHAESGAITGTRVRLAATANCYVVFGASPVADTSSMVLLAGHPEVFTFVSGQKISVLQASGAGVLSITPV